MGTSASGSGPRPTTPLIPNWIPDSENLPPDNGNYDDTADNTPITNPADQLTNPSESPVEENNVKVANRYYEARKLFSSFSKNRSSNHDAFKDSLKSYVRKGGGGSSTLAIRMRPSVARISRFHNVINTFREEGAAAALKSFNLDSYNNRPLLDVLSALTDIIFDDSSIYNNIQDDSITKLAYTNTINRIVEIEGIDLNSLSNENIEVMIALFIEETIATKVICDIGISLFKTVQNCEEIIEIEETAYQIVSGLVRNKIMPEIIATQRGLVHGIEKSIENIYRIAFDSIARSNQQ